jgi:hypothetical protein
MKQPKNKWILPVIAVVVAAAVAAAVFFLCRGESPLTPPVETTEPTETTQPAATLPPMETSPTLELGDGLRVLRMDRYAGIYMEDGTNEIVSDVMMLILENTSDRDLQLARIDVAYADQTAWFEVTNLPAGEKVVLLEKERMGFPGEDYLTVSTRNVVFFQEPMAVPEGLIEVSGTAGLVKLTNISGDGIPGPIYVYYKNSAEDLLYGGITYRVTAAEGLAEGETLTIPAGHYDPEQCRILAIQTGG